LHQNGRIVFIHRSLDKLATDDRPLSKNLEEMYEIRLPMYRRFCDIEVTNDSSPENCAKEILEKLNLI
jgi:shikimate dehydrogenase